MRIHILLPAMLLIACNALSSDVFDMDPNFTYPIGGQHNNVLFASGLLNYDSIPDLILGNYSGDYIRVYYGEGDGSFVTGEQYSIENPEWIQTADVDNDGYIDVIVRSAPLGPDSFMVFLNNSLGVFSNTINTYDPCSSVTDCFAVIDFNGDGIVDIVSSRGSGTVDLLVGNGDGTFNHQILYDEPLGSLALACGDMDADGDIDIVLVSNGMLSVLLNNGDGSVSWKGYYGSYDSEGTEASIALGDLNNDLIPDIACCHGSYDSPAALTFLGEGDGSFTQTGSGFLSFAIAYTQTSIDDYNLDGYSDVFFTGYNGGLLMLGSGDGQLALDYFNYEDAYCWESAIGDFDTDGDIDFVKAVAEYGGSFKIEVFLNRTIQLGIPGEESTDNASLGLTSNPVLENATVCFSLFEPSFCILNAYDIHGRLISQIFKGALAEGDHQFIWDSSVQPAGCYTLVLDTRLCQSSVRCVKTD